MVNISDLPEAGPIVQLLNSPGVTDVLINGTDGVWVDGPGGLRPAAVDCGGPERIRALAVQLAAMGGQRLDDAMPAADAHLPPGVRMHAILPPLAPDGPVISLRIMRPHNFTMDELIAGGMMSRDCSDLLSALIATRVNFLVSGATGAGKTTLLSTMLGLVPIDQRIVCIEEASELQPTHGHFARLEARRANVEGRGEFTLTDLVRQSLRMRPDRIVLGECRGAEVREVLTALNTGHEGSCATIHANTARDVPARLAALGALAGMGADAVAAQASAAIGAVIHVARFSAERRGVAEIAALVETQPGVLRAETAVKVHEAGLQQGPGWQFLAQRCGW